MRNLFSATVIFFFAINFLFLSSPVHARKATQRLPSSQLASAEHEYQFLKEQTRGFREFIQAEREAYQSFFGLVLKAIGLLIAVATLVGGGSYFLALQKAKKVSTKAIVEAFTQNAGEVREALEETTRRIFSERLNLTRPILIISNRLNQGELEKLEQRGIENVTVEAYSEELDLGSANVVVFHFTGRNRRELEAVIDLLEAKGGKTPLIAYTRSGLRNDKFDSYQWRGFAQTPLTLVNTIFTTLNTLS